MKCLIKYTILIIALFSFLEINAQLNKAIKFYEEGNLKKAAKKLVKDKNFDEQLLIDFFGTSVYNSTSKEDKLKIINCLTELIKLRPQFYYLYFMRGKWYFTISNFDGQTEDLNKTIELNPNFCDAYGEKLLSMFTYGRYTKKEISSFYNGMTCDFSRIDSLRLAGYYHYFNENYLETVNAFTKAIELNANFYDMNYVMGRSLVKLKRFDEAYDYYEKQLQLNPMHYNCQLAIAEAKILEGKYDEAIENGKKSIKINPFKYDANNVIGEAYQNLLDYGNAIEYYRKSLEHNPNYYENNVRMGFCFYKKEEYDSSLVYYKRAFQFSRDSIQKASSSISMGLSFQNLKQLDSAIYHFNAASKFNPEKRMNYQLNIVEAYSANKDYKKSVDLLELLLNEYKNDKLKTGTLLFNFSDMYFKRKMYDSTIYYCNQALNYKQGSEIYWKLAGSFYNLKKYPQAISYYKKTLTYVYSNNDKKNLYKFIGNSYVKTHRKDSCEYWYSKVLDIDSSSAMYNTIAWEYYLENYLGEATANIEISIKLNNSNVDAIDTKACILYTKKQYNEALELFDKCLRMNSKYGNSYLYRGKIKIDLNKIDEACIDLKKAAEYGKEEDANKLIKEYCK